jgi:hypothetical protein
MDRAGQRVTAGGRVEGVVEPTEAPLDHRQLQVHRRAIAVGQRALEQRSCALAGLLDAPLAVIEPHQHAPGQHAARVDVHRDLRGGPRAPRIAVVLPAGRVASEQPRGLPLERSVGAAVGEHEPHQHVAGPVLLVRGQRELHERRDDPRITRAEAVQPQPDVSGVRRVLELLVERGADLQQRRVPLAGLTERGPQCEGLPVPGGAGQLDDASDSVHAPSVCPSVDGRSGLSARTHGSTGDSAPIGRPLGFTTEDRRYTEDRDDGHPERVRDRPVLQHVAGGPRARHPGLWFQAIHGRLRFLIWPLGQAPDPSVIAVQGLCSGPRVRRARSLGQMYVEMGRALGQTQELRADPRLGPVMAGERRPGGI